jgi:hypothetical protein
MLRPSDLPPAHTLANIEERTSGKCGAGESIEVELHQKIPRSCGDGQYRRGYMLNSMITKEETGGRLDLDCPFGDEPLFHRMTGQEGWDCQTCGAVIPFTSNKFNSGSEDL